MSYPKEEEQHEISAGRLDFVASELAGETDFKKARSRASAGAVWRQDLRVIRSALRLIAEEKEILVFTALQWAAIGIAYYVWVQFLGWIPIEVWENDNALVELGINLALLAWSLACIGLAAFPIGLFTGAMASAHLLRSAGRKSTLAACLALSMRSAGRLWIFQWIDSWITTERILARLPKRGWASDWAWLAATEALYYAWKTATMAIVPAIVSGHGLVSAGKQSVSFVRQRLGTAVRLRAGYSLLCWVIGIATYVAAVCFLFAVEAFDYDNWVYAGYAWAGIPILIAVGVIKLFVRPVFVLATCIAYVEFTRETEQPITLPDEPSPVWRVLVPFGMLILAVAFVYLFRDTIGLTRLLETAGQP